MQIHYETAAGIPAVIFLLIPGVMIHAEKNGKKSIGAKVRSVIGGIAWILFVCTLSVWIFLMVLSDADGKGNVTDEHKSNW